MSLARQLPSRQPHGRWLWLLEALYSSASLGAVLGQDAAERIGSGEHSAGEVIHGDGRLHDQ
jgi:hypothetical protein